MEQNLFREKSMETLTSPERLDRYIKISRPGTWLLLLAVFLFLVSLTCWGIFGTLSTYLTITGVGEGVEVVCYPTIADSLNLMEGGNVFVEGIPGTVVKVGEIPLSANEVRADLAGDYLKSTLTLSQWNTKVEIALSSPLLRSGACSVKLLVASTSPLSLLGNDN